MELSIKQICNEDEIQDSALENSVCALKLNSIESELFLLQMHFNVQIKLKKIPTTHTKKYIINLSPDKLFDLHN